MATSLPWSVRITCRHRSTPADKPAEVSRSPSSTNSRFSSSFTSGYSARKSSAIAQCVVAGRSSSSPAAPSTNAPVQIDMIRVPGRIVASAAARSSGSVPSYRGPSIRVPGTITVSAQASASGPWSGTIA